MGDSTITLLEVGTNLDTGRAAVVGPLPRDEFGPAFAFAERYLSLAESMIENARSHIHLAYDPGMRAREGSSQRYVSVAGSNQRLGQSIGSALGVDVGDHDFIVIFGAEMLNKGDRSDMMERIVAGDLSVIFDVAYPIECNGPIADYMPALTQVAARILIPGKPEVASKIGGTGKRSVVNVLEDRAENAIDSMIREKAAKDFGSIGDGTMGTLLTALPFLMDFADHVAKEAVDLLQSTDASDPLPFDMMVIRVHTLIANSMRKLGMQVTDKKPVSRIVKYAS